MTRLWVSLKPLVRAALKKPDSRASRKAGSVTSTASAMFPASEALEVSSAVQQEFASYPARLKASRASLTYSGQGRILIATEKL
jgi:hypothetical protein